MDKILFDELWHLIFEYLDLFDLMNMKLICKRFYLLIKQFKLKQLIVIQNGQNYDNYWFYTYEYLNIKNIILNCSNDYSIIFNCCSSFVENLTNLKQLKLEYINENDLDLLNQFKNSLIHLEIDNLTKLTNDKTLNLVNLKILKFNLNLSKGKLILNSNNLQIISLNNLNQIELLKPEMIKHIECLYYNESNQKVNQFSNLKVLKYRKLVLKQIVQLDLPLNLTELYFYTFDYVSDDNLRKYKHIFNSIKQIKINSINLSVFFEGIQLDNYRTFEDYGFNERNDLFDDYRFKILNKNYDFIADKLPEFNIINYNYLESLFNQDQLIKLNRKFINIQSIYIEKYSKTHFKQHVNQDELMKFLKSCPNLSFAYFDNPYLDQQFYEQLTNFNLNKIYLNENEINLNYLFLIKFKLLNQIKLSQNISIDLIIQLLANLKFIGQMQFNHSKLNIIIINKVNKGIYDLKIDQNQQRYQFNELINHLKSINEIYD